MPPRVLGVIVFLMVMGGLALASIIISVVDDAPPIYHGSETVLDGNFTIEVSETNEVCVTYTAKWHGTWSVMAEDEHALFDDSWVQTVDDDNYTSEWCDLPENLDDRMFITVEQQALGGGGSETVRFSRHE